MSVKRLALIAAVGSHHRTISSTPAITTTLSAVTQVLAATPSTATTFTRATTDDDNLKLNAAALGRGASAAADGGNGSRSNEEVTPDDVSSGSGSGGGAAAVSSSETGGSISTSHGFTSGFNYFTEHVAGGGAGGGLYQGHQAMRPGATLHGNVNVLLGGAMLSVVITVVCVVCYCCHRNTKKRSESIYRQQRWSDNAGPNMEVYSVEQCYEASTLYTDSSQPSSCHISPTGHSGPPPSYDSVLAMDEFPSRPPPPPKYQASRHAKPRCCSTARHVAFNHGTTASHHHCRKYHQPQPPSNHGAVRVRGPCSCLQRQMLELSNNRSHLSHNSRDLPEGRNKSVPSSADSLNNNNVSNNNNVTFEIDKPLYEGIDSQLFGKPRITPVPQDNTQLQQQLHIADIENGNVRDSCEYSSATEASFHPNPTNARLIDSGDATNEVTNMNSTHAASTVQVQAAELELNSNLDQKSSRCQQPHGNQQVQSHQRCEQPQREQHQQQQQLGSLNLSALDTFNENGIIRMDMSQIIDTTGLPTYEAAIKLESSGYV